MKNKKHRGMWGMLKEGKIELKVMDLCNECLVLHGLLKDKAMPYPQGPNSRTII